MATYAELKSREVPFVRGTWSIVEWATDELNPSYVVIESGHATKDEAKQRAMELCGASPYDHLRYCRSDEELIRDNRHRLEKEFICNRWSDVTLILSKASLDNAPSLIVDVIESCRLLFGDMLAEVNPADEEFRQWVAEGKRPDDMT